MKNTALITGASSGIGKELALIHAQHKGNLVLVARRADKLNSLKKEIEATYKTSVIVLIKDLTDINTPQEIYNELKEKGIEINVLINNAGFGQVGEFYALPLERQTAMINLNVTSLTILTRLFLPDFIQRNSGKILNTSSTASFMPGPLQAVYFATKAYVTSFSNAISEEIRGTNVTLTNLMPGATTTEFGATSGMDKTAIFNKPASSKTVANDGYQAMLKGKIDVVSGLPFSQKIMMLFIPFTPKKLILKIVHNMQKVKH